MLAFKSILILNFIVFKCILFSGEKIDVTRFGADGTDNFDDTKSIQSAIEYLNKKGGGTLYFPAGTYFVSRQKIPGKAIAIRLSSNIDLLGDKSGKSILKLLPNQLNYTRMLVAENVSNCKLKNLTFDGNYLAQHNPNNPNEHLHGFFIDQSSNIMIDSCKFINTGGDGIGIRGIKKSSSEITIKHSSFNGNRRNGITLGSGFKGVNISKCYFGKEIKNSPIDTEPTAGLCGDVIIEENLIETNNILTLGGVSKDNLGFNQIFRKNILTNGSIYIIYGNSIKIENNDITNSDNKAAITILRKNENILILGNTIKVNDQSAINITYSANQYPSNVKILNNEILYKNPLDPCINIKGGENITIENNHIKTIAPCKLLLKISATRSMNGLAFINNKIGYFEQNFLISFIKENTISAFIIKSNEFENKHIITQNNIFAKRLINSNLNNN